MNIEKALVEFKYESVEHDVLAKFIGFSDEEMVMLKTFWEPCFNKNWFYLYPEFITNELGYKSIRDFYADILRKNYIDNIDYQKIDKNDEIVKKFYSGDLRLRKKPGNRASYYKVTGKTLKLILMRARTIIAMDTHEYYIKVEEVAIFYKDYITELQRYTMNIQLELHAKQIKESKQLLIQSQEQLEQQQTQLKIEQRRHVALREAVENVIHLEKNQVFYIATSDYYQRRNRYKYGGVDDESRLKARLTSYNSDRAEGDFFYYIFIEKCHNYKSIESYLRGHLPDYCKDSKDKYLKEMVKCPWVIFKEIIYLSLHPSGKLTDLINEKCNDIIEGIPIDDDIIKPEIILPDKICDDIKEPSDARQLTSHRVIEIMTDSINQICGQLLGYHFDLIKQSNDQLDLELSWKDIINIILTKTKIKRKKLAINTIWKPTMVQLIRSNNCIKKVKGIAI